MAFSHTLPRPGHTDQGVLGEGVSPRRWTHRPQLQGQHEGWMGDSLCPGKRIFFIDPFSSQSETRVPTPRVWCHRNAPSSGCQEDTRSMQDGGQNREGLPGLESPRASPSLCSRAPAHHAQSSTYPCRQHCCGTTGHLAPGRRGPGHSQGPGRRFQAGSRPQQQVERPGKGLWGSERRGLLGSRGIVTLGLGDFSLSGGAVCMGEGSQCHLTGSCSPRDGQRSGWRSSGEGLGFKLR